MSIWKCILVFLQSEVVFGLHRLEYRIQNGHPADFGDFPSIVLLTGAWHRCTGTLIAADKILTAGHCACGDPMSRAYTNITSLNQLAEPTVQVREIAVAAYPVSYNGSCNLLFESTDQPHNELGGTDDIAILHTDEPFHVVPGYVEVGQISFHPNETAASGQKRQPVISSALVLGFGRDRASKTTGYLRFGLIQLSPCPTDISINTTQALCSNLDVNYQFPLVGDSGGPILDLKHRVVGVTSIAGEGWTVFASVATHADFIRDQLQ